MDPPLGKLLEEIAADMQAMATKAQQASNLLRCTPLSANVVLEANAVIPSLLQVARKASADLPMVVQRIHQLQAQSQQDETPSLFAEVAA